jgi:hypothetical protein
MAARGRASNGGQRNTEIRRIETDEARHVCFSKRREGLFNKASELGIMCDAEVAVVTFSPGNNVYSYGNPSVKSVLNRFSPDNAPEAQALEAVGESTGDRTKALEELDRKHGELRARLRAEKELRDAAAEASAKALAEEPQVAAWLDAYVIQMGEEDLVAFEDTMAKVQAGVATRADHVIQQAQFTGFTMHGGGGMLEFGGTSDTMETMDQLYRLAGMPPPPPPGFVAGMERMPQGFGPHGFPAQ